jgi:hypothetical protein
MLSLFSSSCQAKPCSVGETWTYLLRQASLSAALHSKKVVAGVNQRGKAFVPAGNIRLIDSFNNLKSQSGAFYLTVFASSNWFNAFGCCFELAISFFASIIGSQIDTGKQSSLTFS